MELQITTHEEAVRFLADHERCASAGALALCTCGWAGIDWWQHRSVVLAAWLEARRRALRARLLAEEGVERP